MESSLELVGQTQASSPRGTNDTGSAVSPKRSEIAQDIGDAASVVVSPGPSQHLVSITDERTLPAEKFRMLANRMASIRIDRPLKVIHITSSVTGEGKSLVSSNLAVTLSRRPNEKVLLIEGDFRKPGITRVFGLKGIPGVGEWWDRRSAETLPQLHRIAGQQLWLLAAGNVKRPDDVLLSPDVPGFLNRFAQLFDWVIIDSPPLIPVADASLWSTWADGTLLVVRSGVPTKRDLQKGLETLDKGSLLGVVLNDVNDRSHLNYYDQYYGLQARKR